MTAAAPVLPARLVGAWARESIAVGGDDPAEPQVVRYLQAGRAYADLRLDAGGPGSSDGSVGPGPLCFAGTTAWDPPFVTWHHEVDLDLDAGGHVDRGEIEWLHGGRMAERGTFASPGGPVGYVEVWRPLPVGPGGLLALRGAELPARLVQVGEHALVVCDRRAQGGGFAARYDRRQADAWHTVLSFGNADEVEQLPAPPAERPPAGAVVDIGGLAWLVDESSATPARVAPSPSPTANPTAPPPAAAGPTTARSPSGPTVTTPTIATAAPATARPTTQPSAPSPTTQPSAPSPTTMARSATGRMAEPTVATATAATPVPQPIPVPVSAPAMAPGRGRVVEP